MNERKIEIKKIKLKKMKIEHECDPKGFSTNER
jgi:hypothetical protein